jgi:hypothetical protein
MAHSSAHPQAGQTVTLTSGETYEVEDWWDRVSGGSWMDADGNLAAMKYAVRSGIAGLPLDDEVVYGKIGWAGHLVHVSEIA